MKIVKSTAAIALVLTLTACGTPSVEDIIEDPALMSELNQECLMLMTQGKNTNTEKCNNLKTAQKKMVGNIMSGMLGS